MSKPLKTWRVGTLVYDRRALFNVFFWMLWGDFCLNLMDSGVATTVPLVQLRKFGASKMTIGLLTGSAVELMGTLACLFRVFATAGSFVFSRFLLNYSEDYPGPICLGAAGLYLLAFLLMCFMVKEGKYPPPSPPEGRGFDRAITAIQRYARECYSLPYYWKYYLFTFCFICGFRPFRDFLLLYGKETLKI